MMLQALKKLRVLRYLGLVYAVLMVRLLSQSKGWFSLILPLEKSLILTIPLLMVTQIATNLRLARGTAHASLDQFANIQLVSILLTYLSIPALGDDGFIIFGFTNIPFFGLSLPIKGGIEFAMIALSLTVYTLAASTYIIVTTKLFILLRGKS